MKAIRRVLRIVPLMIVLLVAAGLTLLWVGKIEAKVQARGVVRVARSMPVRSAVAGMVRKVLVRPGEQVEPGQVLVEVETLDLTRQLRDVEQELGDTETEIERLGRERIYLTTEIHPIERERQREERLKSKLQADQTLARVEELRVELDFLKSQAARANRLHDEGLLSAESAESSEQAVRQAEWRLRQAEMAAEEADAEHELILQDADLDRRQQRWAIEAIERKIVVLERRRKALDERLRDLRRQDEERRIKATLRGIAVGLDPKLVEGATIAAGETLFTIIDPQSIAFVSYVPARAIFRIEEGQPAAIEMQGLAKEHFEPIHGRVQRIERVAVENGVGPVYPVLIELQRGWVPYDDGRFYLLDGMEGQVEIVHRSRIRILRFLMELLSGSPRV